MDATPPPLDDIPVCTPPRSRRLDDGTTIRAGSRVRHAPTGALCTVDSFAGPGWALVRWDGGGQALTPPCELASEPPPTCCGMR
jgi:hypothetical protein